MNNDITDKFAFYVAKSLVIGIAILIMFLICVFGYIFQGKFDARSLEQGIVYFFWIFLELVCFVFLIRTITTANKDLKK